MDKAFLLKQLAEKLKQTAEAARDADELACREAHQGAQRAVNLSRATRTRLDAAQAAWLAVNDFQPTFKARGAPAGLGSIVEIEDDSGGRTLLIAPAGAGEELTLADGDGFLHVVTPASPLGKALLGKRVRDSFDVTLRGEPVTCTVTYVG
jgi:transcription elongation GreA/GreB family factor